MLFAASTTSDVTSVNAIPCTTVARTLLDLADVVNRRTLERVCDQAEVMRIFDGRALEQVLARAAGRRGTPILRSILQEHEIGATVTESELEERFLALCAQARIARPRVNAWIALDEGAVKADFLWPEQRLVLETDGRRVHGSRRAFEQDRRRDQRLLLAGYRVVRLTWRQLVDNPDQIATLITALLAEA
jgi:very-short-patch-repair endonuclease